MDREVVLVVLVTVFFASALFAAGAWPWRADRPAAGREEERALWLGMWLRFAPGTLVLSGLVGWALQEPDNSDESVSRPLVLVGVAFGVIWVRAIARALFALRAPPGNAPAVTVGLLRPRVLVASWFAKVLDRSALQAVHQHEQAHARHRDPLRIWIAQLATDLLWPLPAPASHLERWLEALEIARDEEVREAGTHGADLAAAIVAAARHGKATGGWCAAIAGNGRGLAERVERLLAPLPQAPGHRVSRWPVSLFAAGVIAACALGYRFGETVVRALPGVLT